MTTTTMIIIGDRKVINMLKSLPKKIRKEVGEKGSKDIALSGQRRIVHRYNVRGYGQGPTSTGRGLASLKGKLKFQRRGNSFVYSLSPEDYLMLIEKGVASHFVSPNIIEFHMSNPGATLGRTARELGLLPYTGRPFYWVNKGPFVAPALQALESDIPKIIEKRLAKVIADIKK